MLLTSRQVLPRRNFNKTAISKFFKNFARKPNGFTLVEMMIVVAIIALLAAIAIPNLTRSKVSANDAAAQSTLKSIGAALENYYAINNNYPTATSALLGATPPYLNKDYFVGNTNGFSFTSVLTDYTYLITASPVSSSSGTSTFTISTGSVLSHL